MDERIIVPIFMILSGSGIFTVWTKDILKGDQIDMSGGFFKARDPMSRQLMWPHWFAEYLTGAVLFIGAAGLLLEVLWGSHIAFLALGMLLYTSLNSQSWVLASKGRYPYAVPMGVSLLGVFVSFLILIL